jgi:hypothetical protein
MFTAIPANTLYTWGATILLGVGLGLIVFWILSSISNIGFTIYDRTPGRRMAKRLHGVGLLEEKKKDASSYIAPAVNAVRSRAGFPMWVTLVVAALSLLGYVYTQSVWALGLIFLYIIARMWARAQDKRREHKDVWLFLLDLRTKLTFKGSLLTALTDVAKDGRTTCAKIVQIYLDAGFQGNGLSLLGKIAQDTKLPFLDDVVARAEASASGKLSLDDALHQAIEKVQYEIDTAAKEQLQKIPSRLIIIVFPTLLGPGLVLLLYPVVDNLLKSLQGMGGVF